MLSKNIYLNTRITHSGKLFKLIESKTEKKIFFRNLPLTYALVILSTSAELLNVLEL